MKLFSLLTFFFFDYKYCLNFQKLLSKPFTLTLACRDYCGTNSDIPQVSSTLDKLEQARNNPSCNQFLARSVLYDIMITRLIEVKWIPDLQYRWVNHLWTIVYLVEEGFVTFKSNCRQVWCAAWTYHTVTLSLICSMNVSYCYTRFDMQYDCIILLHKI